MPIENWTEAFLSFLLLVIVACALATSGCFPVKTIHEINGEKLTELLTKVDNLDKKMTQMQEQFNSLTNQVFMLPIFPQEEMHDITNNIMLLEHTIN